MFISLFFKIRKKIIKKLIAKKLNFVKSFITFKISGAANSFLLLQKTPNHILRLRGKFGEKEDSILLYRIIYEITKFLQSLYENKKIQRDFNINVKNLIFNYFLFLKNTKEKYKDRCY